MAVAKDGGPLPPAVEQLVAALDEARHGGHGEFRATPAKNSDPPAPATGACEYTVKFVPGHDILLYGMDPLLLLRDLARLGKIAAGDGRYFATARIRCAGPRRMLPRLVIRLVTDRAR